MDRQKRLIIDAEYQRMRRATHPLTEEEKIKNMEREKFWRKNLTEERKIKMAERKLNWQRENRDKK